MELIQELFVAVIVRWLHSHHLLWKANSNKHMLPSPHPTLHVSARYLLPPQWDHLALYAFSLPLTFECIPTLLFFFQRMGKDTLYITFWKFFFVWFCIHFLEGVPNDQELRDLIQCTFSVSQFLWVWNWAWVHWDFCKIAIWCLPGPCSHLETQLGRVWPPCSHDYR